VTGFLETETKFRKMALVLLITNWKKTWNK